MTFGKPSPNTNCFASLDLVKINGLQLLYFVIACTSVKSPFALHQGRRKAANKFSTRFATSRAPPSAAHPRGPGGRLLRPSPRQERVEGWGGPAATVPAQPALRQHRKRSPPPGRRAATAPGSSRRERRVGHPPKKKTKPRDTGPGR